MEGGPLSASPAPGKATFPIGKAAAIPGAVSKGLPVTGVVILASTGVSIVALRVTPLEWLSVVAVLMMWPSVPGVLPGKCMDWSEGSPCFLPVSQGHHRRGMYGMVKFCQCPLWLEGPPLCPGRVDGGLYKGGRIPIVPDCAVCTLTRCVLSWTKVAASVAHPTLVSGVASST